MIVIDKQNSYVWTLTLYPSHFARILDCAVFLVVQEQYAVTKGYCNVRGTVIVIVSCSTADRVKRWIEASLPSYVLKLAISCIPQKRHATPRTVIRYEHVNATVRV